MPITATELATPEAGANDSRPQRLASTPEWLLRVSVESLLIVLSILLALGVDEWRESRSYQELADQSLLIFAQELEQNFVKLDDVVPYHMGLHQVVAEMAADAERVVEVHTIVEGLQPTVLQNTAWETALATGAFRHIDVNTVSHLSRIYSMQQQFRDKTTLGRPELFVTNATTPEQQLEQMQHALMYLTDVVRAEQDLLGVYQLALEEIPTLARFRSTVGGSADSTGPAEMEPMRPEETARATGGTARRTRPAR